MTLEEFIEGLKLFVKENPDSLKMQVITSKDDEGNDYNLVHYSPSKGLFEDNDYIPYSQYEEWNVDDIQTNAVCIN